MNNIGLNHKASVSASYYDGCYLCFDEATNVIYVYEYLGSHPIWLMKEQIQYFKNNNAEVTLNPYVSRNSDISWLTTIP
jgi:hypothetical protein